MWQSNNPNDENDGFKIKKKIYYGVFQKCFQFKFVKLDLHYRS